MQKATTAGVSDPVPRWDWLASHPGGTSVALRKPVEEARRDHIVRLAFSDVSPAIEV